MLKIKIGLLATCWITCFSPVIRNRKKKKLLKLKLKNTNILKAITIQSKKVKKWKVDDNMMLHIRNMEKDVVHFDQKKIKIIHY